MIYERNVCAQARIEPALNLYQLSNPALKIQTLEINFDFNQNTLSLRTICNLCFNHVYNRINSDPVVAIACHTTRCIVLLLTELNFGYEIHMDNWGR